MAGLSGDEYAKLLGRLSDFADHLEQKRDSAKAAATHYPSKAATVLGEADAYDDAAEDVREILKTLPK
jgi:hypothetical protein